MSKKINFEKILFLDIETVPYYQTYEALPETTQKLWNEKAKYLVKNEEQPSDIYRRAGIYAEFGKIICICAGFINDTPQGRTLRLKSFYSDDEHKLLSDFKVLLDKSFNSTSHVLCAHNGKEFDFPFLSRRFLINGLELPTLLDSAGKKPWEINHLDTMELWKFGDYKHYTSLNLLANVFNIPTPKDDISGSQVYEVYWLEKNLERIAIYCQKDVVTVAQIFLKMNHQSLIEKKSIIYS